MITVQEFIDKTNLPAFITTNTVFRSFDRIEKVYPKLGLPNCKEDVELDNIQFVTASAATLVETFKYIFNDQWYRLIDYKRYFSDKKVTDEKLESIVNLGNVIQRLSHSLKSSEVIRNDNGKISLKMFSDITDTSGKIIFKTNESLFRVYNKIYQLLIDLKCGIKIERLDSMPEFKRFSSDNLPADRFQIVFSSDGLDGLWDIATMSMRGITSCQSWTGQYKKNIIGSIVDPFVGVIYLTSGASTKFGTKMVKRSVVRLAVDGSTKKPFIFIDRMYPENDDLIKEKFINFIKSRVGEKFEVRFGPAINYYTMNSSYIPISKAHSKLTPATRSYRDTKIQFKIEMPTEVNRLDKNIQSKQAKFRNLFRNTSFTSAHKCRESLDYFENETKKCASAMTCSPDFKYLIRDYYRDVASKAIKNLGENKDSLTSTEYMRKLCFYYINNKDSITRGIRSVFVRKINKYFNKDRKYDFIFKINYKTLSKVLEPVQKDIDKNIKYEIKLLLSKKSLSANLPN